MGTVIGAWDGRRAWICRLAVLPDRQGCGRRAEADGLERRLQALGAINLNVLAEREKAVWRTSTASSATPR